MADAAEVADAAVGAEVVPVWVGPVVDWVTVTPSVCIGAEESAAAAKPPNATRPTAPVTAHFMVLVLMVCSSRSVLRWNCSMTRVNQRKMGRP